MLNRYFRNSDTPKLVNCHYMVCQHGSEPEVDGVRSSKCTAVSYARDPTVNFVWGVMVSYLADVAEMIRIFVMQISSIALALSRLAR